MARLAVLPAAHQAEPRARPAVRRLTVLGATGSIGASTLDLVGRCPESFEVVALTAQSNAAALAELAIRHRARLAVIGEEARYGELKGAIRAARTT